MNHIFICGLLAVTAACAAASFPPTYNASGPGWKYYCEGDCPYLSREEGIQHLSAQNYVEVPPTPGFILMGGGLDDGIAFRQQSTWGGGGNFLILRADDDNAYNDWVYQTIGGVRSAATIVVYDRVADEDPFVLSVLNNASALFVAGGDQWEYFTLWKNSKIASYLHSKAANHIPLGGTSAGCMILSPQVFDAQFDGITSSEALRDPLQEAVSIAPGWVNVSILPKNSLLDTHFFQRDRFGRLLVFVARMLDRNGGPAYGIGISQHSAFTVDADGIGVLQGNPCTDTSFSASSGSSNSASSSSAAGGNDVCGTAFVLYGTSPVVLTANKSLTMQPIRVQKLVAGDRFNFNTMEGGQPQNVYHVGAFDGKLSKEDPYNP